MPTNHEKNLSALPNILTLQQACDVLNCHPNTLRAWDNKGILKAMRFGKRRDRRYHKEEIIKFINNHMK